MLRPVPHSCLFKLALAGRTAAALSSNTGLISLYCMWWSPGSAHILELLAEASWNGETVVIEPALCPPGENKHLTLAGRGHCKWEFCIFLELGYKVAGRSVNCCNSIYMWPIDMSETNDPHDTVPTFYSWGSCLFCIDMLHFWQISDCFCHKDWSALKYPFLLAEVKSILLLIISLLECSVSSASFVQGVPCWCHCESKLYF